MRKGFTLIELLVVIAIIAILAAILFPVFAAAKNKAQQSSCLNNLKQIMMAESMYTNDHDQMLQLSPFGWYGLLNPYIQNDQIWFCPSNTGAYGPLYDWSGTTCYISPGYACNDVFWYGNSYPHTNPADWGWVGKPLDYFNGIAHFVLFNDGNPRSMLIGMPLSEGYSTVVKGADTYYWQDGDETEGSYNPSTIPPSDGQIIGIHNGETNCGFLDGHVAAVQLSTLFAGNNAYYYWDAEEDAPGYAQDVY